MVNKRAGVLLFFMVLITVSGAWGQFPVEFSGGFFTKVSKQTNLLFGGIPNRVFLERSLFGSDSIRIEPADSLLSIKRDSGNWYTITPKAYMSIKHQTDQYDSMLKLSMNDVAVFSDRSFQRQFTQLESYVYTERVNKYETYFTIYHLIRKDNKYVVKSRSHINVEVIPVKYDVFPLFDGRRSGWQISKEEFFSNPSLTTSIEFSEEDRYITPSIPDTFEVVSFDVSWDAEDGEIGVEKVSGNKLSPQTKSRMRSSVTDESLILFENIKVKSKLTGQVQKVPPFLINLKKSSD